MNFWMRIKENKKYQIFYFQKLKNNGINSHKFKNILQFKDILLLCFFAFTQIIILILWIQNNKTSFYGVFYFTISSNVVSFLRRYVEILFIPFYQQQFWLNFLNSKIFLRKHRIWKLKNWSICFRIHVQLEWIQNLKFKQNLLIICISKEFFKLPKKY